MEIDNQVHATNRNEWRKWLEENAETDKYCWLVLSRKQNEFTYIDAVEEALCFGWIDSTKKRLGRATYCATVLPSRSKKQLDRIKQRARTPDEEARTDDCAW